MSVKLIVVAARYKHIVDWGATRRIPKSMLHPVFTGEQLKGADRHTPHILLDGWDDVGYQTGRGHDVAYIDWKLREMESPNVGGYVDWFIAWMRQHPQWKAPK